jgi:hypothetical protein
MSTPRYDTGMASDALADIAKQIVALGEQLAAEVVKIEDLFQRGRAAAPLERQLRQGPDAIAKLRKKAIVESYRRQQPKNVAALARGFDVSPQRIRTVLTEAGVLELDGNGRRKHN